MVLHQINRCEIATLFLTEYFLCRQNVVVPRAVILRMRKWLFHKRIWILFLEPLYSAVAQSGFFDCE